MRNITGAVAEGVDFFNRISEINRFWQNLETDNLLLLAPRRVGKTSLMKEMFRQADSRGFTPVFADVSDCPDELGFIQRLYNAILNSHLGERVWKQIEESWLGKIVQRVQKIGGAGFSLEFRADSTSWTRMGEELASALSKLDGSWLIQIDELPVFVLKLLNQAEPSSRSRVREFLYWMRQLRQHYTTVRWMLAGSIGLDTIAARLNIADAINDLRIEKLGAFDTATAHSFLHALATSYDLPLSESERAYILERSGWLAPYYLQLIFHELRVRKAATRDIVDEVIEDLLGPLHRNYFDYWRQRLFEELGRPDADHAILLLHKCCRSAQAVSRNTLSLVLSAVISDPDVRDDKLRYLLDVLQNDGYLVDEEKRYRFQSPLLREYWLRRLAPEEQAHKGEANG